MNTQTPQYLRAAQHTLRIEGGFVNNRHDRGGPTNMGITMPTLDTWYHQELGREATLDDLRNLTRDDALQLYCDLYWWAQHPDLPCQELSEWWEPLGLFAFDCRVNHLPDVAGVLIQRALNIINRDEKAWPDLKVDGWVGPSTMDAIRKVDVLSRGKERLMTALVFYRGKYMIEIAENRPNQEEFISGWLFRVGGFIPKTVASGL